LTRRATRRLRSLVAAIVVGAVGVVGVVGAEAAVAAAAATAAPKPPALRVLVTNDDGVSAPGIDALVSGLRALDRVKVTVVAPATNQSGTSDRTTPGPLTTGETTTASGYRAIAVQGYPADTVNFALDGGIPTKPHLVASGVNQGQNLGPVVNVSGTVGAARTAVRRGVPAVAISQGSGEPPDYAAGVREAVRWVKKHRKALTKKKPATPTDVANINVPTCTTGKVRGLIEVPSATTGDAAAPSDCLSTLKNPPDDVVAFANGYAALSKVPPG
jgi:5'-nucleotidase